MRRIALAALVALATANPANAQSPVKIGLITTLSTPGGYIGEDIRDGFQLAAGQEGGKLGGVPVELVVADDGLNPTTGKEIAQRMLQRDGVKIFSGTVFSVVALAIVPDLMRAGAFYVSANTGPVDFAGKGCQPNYFVASWHNEASVNAAGVAATRLGAKRVVTIAANYYAGKEATAAFKHTYKGQVVDEILVKLNQTDYAAEISQIRAAKPDGVYSFLPGGMGISFLRQMQQAGLTDIKQFNGTTIDAKMMGIIGEAGKNVVGTTFWNADFDNPVSKQFVSAFRAAYKREPSVYAAQGYDAARLIGSALRATKGNVADDAGFRAALRAAKFDSVRGKFRFGKDQYPVQDWYMAKATRNEAGGYYLKTDQKLLSDYASPNVDECTMK
jgi:branched-chain amino acid transport system substrate-binding protein